MPEAWNLVRSARLPGFAADAALHRASSAYGGALRANGGADRTLVQQLALGIDVVARPPFRVPPVERACPQAWQCEFGYRICRSLIPRCIGDCLDNSLAACAGSSDPAACEARYWQFCSGTCTVTCDQAYADCLSCR